MLKSLHIGIKYQSGGEGRMFSELRRTLPEAGCAFRGLVAGPDNVGHLSAETSLPLQRKVIPLLKRFQGVRRSFQEAIMVERPDIIASHFALYACPVTHLASDIPRVTHFMDLGPPNPRSKEHEPFLLKAKYLMEKFVYTRSAHTIVLSDAFAKLAANRYGIAPEAISVIPGAVDLLRFNLEYSKAEARALLELPQDVPIVLSVRRLVNRMGLASLVNAIPSVVKQIPEVLFVIAGHGPLGELLKAQAKLLGIERHVRFPGFVAENHLAPLYRAADVNIVPTIELEGFGLVAAEALACGTPSLVTPIGGLPEVVSPLSSTLVLASTSTEDIAERVVSGLLGSVPFPSSEQCHAYAACAFDPQLMASRTVAVYRKALQ